jgi:hypothetical protein
MRLPVAASVLVVRSPRAREPAVDDGGLGVADRGRRADRVGVRSQRGLRQQVVQAAQLSDLAIDALRDTRQLLQPRRQPPRCADVMEELFEPA